MAALPQCAAWFASRSWWAGTVAVMTASRAVESIARDLEAEFRRLPAGTRLPSEQMLAERFGIGRGAARGIIDGFRRRGLVRRRPGAGTFWHAEPEVLTSATGVPSFSAWVQGRGDRPGTQLRRCASRRATNLEREYLGLDAGSTVWVVQRRFCVNDVPTGFATSVLPQTSLPALHRAVADVGSIYQTLQGRYGLRVSRKWQRVRAALPPAEVGAALGPSEAAELWLVESLNVAAGGRPIEYARTYIRADYASPSVASPSAASPSVASRPLAVVSRSHGSPATSRRPLPGVRR
jgi:DNA-binding GntR family transcriptional regulator